MEATVIATYCQLPSRSQRRNMRHCGHYGTVLILQVQGPARYAVQRRSEFAVKHSALMLLASLCSSF